MLRISAMLLTAILSLSAITTAAEVHQAITDGNTELAKKLIEMDRGLLEEPDDDGYTPLLTAASEGQLELIQYLLEKGANRAASNLRGSDAMTLAVYSGHLDLTKYLMSEGFAIDQPNPRGFTPFLFACYMGHVDLAQLLLDSGADLLVRDSSWGGAAVHWTANHGTVEVMQLLVEKGLSLAEPCLRDSSPPILWAANGGNNDVLEMILASGISADTPMPNGWTPLLNACNAGHLETAQMLLEAGANPSLADTSGTLPINSVIDAGSLDFVKLLVEHGADPTEADVHGNTPLLMAALRGHEDLADYLISAGCDINRANDIGYTPLLWGVTSGNLDLLDLLIDSGADLNHTDDDGHSAVWNAMTSGSKDAALMLLEAGARCGAALPASGLTPLHLAAIKGSSELATRLLQTGAVVNAIDIDDHTPLYYSARYGHSNVSDVLIEAGGAAADLIENYGFSPLVAEQVPEGQAEMWYLGHCGFAVKTASQVMVFDYWTHGLEPDQPLLANGHVNPTEFGDLPVTVFVTHDHQDHLDSAIFSWAELLPDITYVSGCRFEDSPMFRDSGYQGPAYEYIGPREQRTINGIDVTTIASNDGGVGFLAKVDGLELYHAGDHAGWNQGERDGFVSEIDFLAEHVSALDMAFVNVTGCHTGDTIALAEATCYTLERLKPRMWIPTHGLDREHVYQTFADKIARMGYNTEALCAKQRGDHFCYRKEEI